MGILDTFKKIEEELKAQNLVVIDADAGTQALIKAYNGALKEPVLLAVAREA